ncbi:MAG: B12-binding domain-containing radical SAM protein [Planctomycetota bacterium]
MAISEKSVNPAPEASPDTHPEGIHAVNCREWANSAEWSALYGVRASLNVLMVMPRFPTTFWGLDYTFRDILSGPRYPLPPLSLLTVAAFFPASWNVRVVDENVRSVGGGDWRWADVLMMNAMLVQAQSVSRLTRRAHDAGLPVVLGGPHPSLAPEHYPEADYIHRGEVGDATPRLFADLARTPGRPSGQRVYTVGEKLPLTVLPRPRYDLIRAGDYLSLSLQFAVGCPFNCEFCDIIEIYGRKPRVKNPGQILSELDGLLATGHRGSVFFVDDNFIGNLPRVKALLPHIIRWQAEHGHPFKFYTEASVNLAEHKDLLEDMRRAEFYAVFLGIETTVPEDLQATQKSQNARRPLLDSVRIIQSYGLEIWAGFILGFDTDRADAGERMVAFIEESAVTLAMVNLLNAPIGTQLWRRLKSENRLLPVTPAGDNVTDTNIAYRQGQEAVFRQFRDVWDRLYDPVPFLRRVRRNLELTRNQTTHYGRLLSWRVKLRSMPGLFWQMGVRGAYRVEFLRLFLWSLRHGLLDAFFSQMGMAYHCIRFRERVLSGCMAQGAEPPAKS